MNTDRAGTLWIPIRQLTDTFDRKISGNRIYCCTRCGAQSLWVNNGVELQQEIKDHNCIKEDK